MIVTAVVLLLAAGALIKAVTVIPQAQAAVVERAGRFTRTLPAGVNILVPFVDSVRARVDLREQVVTFPPQAVITRDIKALAIDNVIYYQVTDPRSAVYEVASYIVAMKQLVVTTLREKVGAMDLERALLSRDELNTSLREVLDDATVRWGIRVNRVAIKAIDPPAGLLARENGTDGTRGTPDTPASDGGPAPYPVHEQPLHLDDPRTVGPYRLTARLGEGGDGRLYLGRSSDGRAVAVRVIRPELAADPAFRERFARESEAARRVGGLHTAAVADAGPHGTHPWLATEYIPGPALHDVLARHGALPPKTLHILALGLAEALEALHSCAVLHRDLRPGNVIVSRTGPRVVGFAVAPSGTQDFLAPEQLTATPPTPTPATDIYAFALVLCHAAGAVPAGDADADSLRTARALLPAGIGDVITHCLNPDPAARPTATAVLDQLTRHHPWSEDWLPPPIRQRLPGGSA